MDHLLAAQTQIPDFQQYKVARDILENNKDIAHAMVKALMEWETIDRDQIRDIMEGRE
ncbi:hypothetical protein HN306_20605, partial [Acinetobacter baumannii]|nr:hypothetical protein [Acinetobacter baumannii]